MRRIQRLAISASILTSLWCSTVFAQSIRLAQLTDAHIFDSANKDRDSLPENERGLRWAIQEINRLNEMGPAFDFVAYTGDFGLEKGLEGVADDQIDAALDGMVERFQEFLDASLVRVWLFVPGNNDLIKENPETINHYHSFLRRLQHRLGAHKDVKNLAPRPGEPVWMQRGNCWFFGLDNASFKSNNKPTDRDLFAKSQMECLGLLKKNLGAAREENDDFNAKPENQEKPRKFFAYTFCHTPDIDDPYRASLKKTDEDLVDEMKRADDEEKKPADGEEKKPADGEEKKPADGELKKYPRSAWVVTKEVRDLWHEILEHDEVKRVFAGHFHSDGRRLYHDVSLLKNPKYAYKAASFEKLLICPPTSAKNQL